MTLISEKPTSADFVAGFCDTLYLTEAPRDLQEEGWTHSLAGRDYLNVHHQLGNVSVARCQAGSEDWIDAEFECVLHQWKAWVDTDEYATAAATLRDAVRTMVVEVAE